MTTVRFTILGEPASGKNSREIVKFGKRMALVKSKKAQAYEKAARLQIPADARQMLTGPVRLTVHAYYASERPDLDVELLRDLLQPRYSKVKLHDHRAIVERGVFVNDRQVREQHAYHHVDRVNPRAEIEVQALEGQAMALDLEPVPEFEDVPF